MSGTEDSPEGQVSFGAARRQTASVVRALTSAGLFCYVGWIMFLFRQIERVVRVSPQQFGGLWDQRIEVLSFVVLPPNCLILVPAAAAAAAATWIAGSAQEIDLAILLRLVTWSANLLAGIAVVSAISGAINDAGSPTRVGDIAMRVAGLLFALAISSMCRAADRDASLA